MRANLLVVTGSAILFLLVGLAVGTGQPPGEGKGAKGKSLSAPPADGKGKTKSAPKPPNEDKELLDEIKEAYKAQYEVHEDVLKELRKAYREPTPKREEEIFKELRRLYVMTADQEAAILREIRRAYDRPSPEQEERIFEMIDRAERLPPGAVAPLRQSGQARKLFLKLDRSGDGALSSDELPDSLREDRRWDMNRDGFIDGDEYWAYYQGRLDWLSEQVASGQIDLGMKRGGPTAIPPPPRESKPAPAAARPGKPPPGLPDWFRQLDTDGDAQIGFYEWRMARRPLEQFFRMDRNDDGFVTREELARYLAQEPGKPSDGRSRPGTSMTGPPGKR